MQRIVLDTNCLLQIIPRVSPFHKVWDAIRRGDIHLCVTTEILNEYHEVLAKQTSAEIADGVITLILRTPGTEYFSPTFRFLIISQDPDDNKFVDCAVVARAQYIVSNDRHFDEVRACPFPMVSVLTLPEFAEVVE